MVVEDRYLLTGRITDSSTGLPVEGVHVRAYDDDPVWDDRLGNADTDARGAFATGFGRRDFAEPFEGEPEVYIVVYSAAIGGVEIGRSATATPDADGRVDISVEVDTSQAPVRITAVHPEDVRPGTFVTVEGAGFGSTYDDVEVRTGGREALVLSVEPTRLRFRVPPAAGAVGPLEITAGDASIVLDDLLRPLPLADEGIVGTVGHPVTFGGATAAALSLDPVGTQQPVLVVLCSPSDRSPTDGGLTAAEERQRQIDAFEQLVNPAFRQMSMGRTDFAFTYTPWFDLPEDDDHYFWRPTDINAAQTVVDELPEDATEEEKDEAQAALDTAEDRQQLLQRGDAFYHDVLRAAIDAGFDIDDYAGVMACIATDHLRGQASGRPNTVEKADETIVLNGGTYLWVVSYNAHWGRRTHELAHATASPDLYSDTGVIATAARWDMMGNHNRMPLFTGHNMVDRLDWYIDTDDVADPAESNVLRLRWTDEPEHGTSYLLRAHTPADDTQDDVYNIIRLEIFDGLTYHVQVRQEPDAVPVGLSSTADSLAAVTDAVAAATADPDQALYDTHVDFPGAAPAHRGGVIVTKVVDDDGPLNQKLRQITLLSPELMQAGDEIVDPARRLTIGVTSIVSERPLTYRVRVTWQDTADADPNGLFNLRIRPWDSSYQTNDIWIDSVANEWDVYETALEPTTGNPLGNGDRPWVDHGNRLYARIHNFGVVDANDVQVGFYLNSPPAVGDAGTWVPHDVQTVDLIPAGSSAAVSTTWTPDRGEHTCVKVDIETQLGETEVRDNGAQENVSVFNTEGGSPHQPIVLDVRLQNPLLNWAKLELNARGLPPGWELTTANRWVWLRPLGEKTVEVALFTDKGRSSPLGRQPAADDEIAPDISCVIEASEYRWYGTGPNTEGLAEHRASIGGVQLRAHARRHAELDLTVDPRAGGFVADGGVTPAVSDRAVLLELVGPDGRSARRTVQSGIDGRFQIDARDFDEGALDGIHKLQAFIVDDDVLADTESARLSFDVPPIIID